MTRVRQTGDLSKPHTLHSRAIMDFAKDQPCTLRIPGVCNGDPATTINAHVPSPLKSQNSKGDDWFAVHACSACHDVLDGRSPKPWDSAFRRDRDVFDLAAARSLTVGDLTRILEAAAAFAESEIDFRKAVIRAIHATQKRLFDAGLLTMKGAGK